MAKEIYTTDREGKPVRAVPIYERPGPIKDQPYAPGSKSLHQRDEEPLNYCKGGKVIKSERY